MSESSGDQIHAATPTRREQARRDGDVPKSLELAAALQMLGALTAAYLLFGQIGSWIRDWTKQSWTDAGSQLTTNPLEFTRQIQEVIGQSLSVLAPLMGLLLLIGVASHWLQTGPMFLAGRVSPDPTRLGAGNWKRQFFSISNLAFLLVGIPKTIVAGLVLATSVWFQRMQFFSLANYPTDVMTGKMLSLILTTTAHVAFALFITSALDYGLKFVSHQRRLKMTDQQLRDELRTQSGGQINRQRRPGESTNAPV